MKIEKQITVSMSVNEYDLAELFCNMDDEQQAKFFHVIALLTKQWNVPFSFQMSAVSSHESLTDEARSIMQTIGEYGQIDTE